MTVKELIEQLNNLDPNKEVVYVDEYNYIQPIIHVDTIERAGNNFVRLYWRIICFKRKLRHAGGILNTK